jgi:RNA methyltransferase, TrmH family
VPEPEPGLAQRYREARRDPDRAVIEGFHALKHALRFGADVLDVRTRDAVALLRLATELAPDVADRIRALATVVDGSIYDALAPAAHPTNVIALARRPIADARAVFNAAGPAPIVLLDRPTHHGNIGAVVRVAAAAGAAGVFVTGSHDPWHPASLRGGAGLQFALPVARLDAIPATDRPIVALDPEGEPLAARSERGVRIPPGAVLVFGSERRGLSAGVLERAEHRVAIEMRPGVSSLNLATAVAVTLFCG